MSRSESKLITFLQNAYAVFMTIFGLPLAFFVLLGPFVMAKVFYEAARDGVLVENAVSWVILGYVISVALVWPYIQHVRGRGPKWLD